MRLLIKMTCRRPRSPRYITPFLRLPLSVIATIADKHLSLTDRVRLASTCKTLRPILDNRLMWTRFDMSLEKRAIVASNMFQMLSFFIDRNFADKRNGIISVGTLVLDPMGHTRFPRISSAKRLRIESPSVTVRSKDNISWPYAFGASKLSPNPVALEGILHLNNRSDLRGANDTTNLDYKRISCKIRSRDDAAILGALLIRQGITDLALTMEYVDANEDEIAEHAVADLLVIFSLYAPKNITHLKISCPRMSSADDIDEFSLFPILQDVTFPNLMLFDIEFEFSAITEAYAISTLLSRMPACHTVIFRSNYTISLARLGTMLQSIARPGVMKIVLYVSGVVEEDTLDDDDDREPTQSTMQERMHAAF